MKRVIVLLSMIAGFLPAFLSAQEEALWITPAYNLQYLWETQPGYRNVDPDAACQQDPRKPSDTNIAYFNLTYGLIVLDENTRICTWFKTDTSAHTQFNAIRVQDYIYYCDNPDYQIAVDTDEDGEVDQCHRSICPASEYFWSTVNTNGASSPSGKVCLEGGGDNSISCEYEAIENTDGTRNPYTFQPTGSGCNCTDSESVPCYPLADGEVTNYPQGQDGCVQLSDGIFCSANPEEHCENGVCDSGCGYIGTQFVCIETNVTEEEALPCQANDQRFSCNNIPEGDCPTGVINCVDPNENETPPEPCQEGDTRPECEGVPVGGTPVGSGQGGATSGDINQLGAKLDQVNKNLQDIKKNTQSIADALNEEHDAPEVDPDDNTEWQNTKSLLEQYTSAGDVNDAQADFESNFSSQEGFYNSQIAGLVPSGGSCTDLSMNLPSANFTIEACQYIQPIRIVIEWALVLGFMVYLRSAFERLKPNGA